MYPVKDFNSYTQMHVQPYIHIYTHELQAFPLHTYLLSTLYKDSLKAATNVWYCGIKIPHSRTFSCTKTKKSFFPLFSFQLFVALTS